MNHSQPLGSLGGGGWESSRQSGAVPQDRTNQRNNKDKVLTGMYDMFLDCLEPEVIKTVVESYNYNYKKSMEALLEMSETTLPSTCQPTPANHPAREAQKSRGTFTSSQVTKKPQTSSSQTAKYSYQVGQRPPPHTSNTPLSNLAVKGVQKSSVKQNVSSSLSTPGSSFKKKKYQDLHSNDNINWFLHNGQKIMIIMRGCPGSGKSYLAKRLIMSYGGNPKDHIFSTDDFFVKRNGYCFNPSQLQDAHQWNQHRVLEVLRKGRSPIIIDNTNTQLWEMTIYASLAINNGYAIEILEPETPWFTKADELARRNEHQVPRDKIKIMLDRYEQGITAESLIKATGAKYSKPIPQAAKYPLGLQREKHFGNRDASSSKRCAGDGGGLREQTQISNLNLMPNFNNYFLNRGCSKETSKAPPDLAQSDVRHDFYFDFHDTSQIKDLNPITDFSEEGSCKETSEHVVLKTNETDCKLTCAASSPVSLSICESDPHSSPKIEAGKEICPVSANSVDILAGINVITNGEDTLAITESVVSDAEKHNQDDSESKIKSYEDNCGNSFLIKDGGIVEPIDVLSLPSCSHIDQVESKIGGFHAASDCQLSEDSKSSVFDTPSNSQSKDPKEDVSSLIEKFGKIGTKTENTDHVLDNSLPQFPQSFSSKETYDYCQSVQDLNSTSQNRSVESKSSGNSFSWKPIYQLQKDLIGEKSVGSYRTLENSLLSRFRHCDVADKSTNTHHSDFCILTNLSQNNVVKDVTILDAFDRDINEGKSISNPKMPLKLMLDKGTSTENDFESELKSESKLEIIKELSGLFVNSSTASIKELLKQCNWDVSYVSNILLDDPIPDNFTGDGNIDEDSDLESFTQEQPEEREPPVDTGDDNNHGSICEDSATAVNVKEDAEDVKRHIELSIDFSERNYSPHTLAIKNFRRGLREGAIPKNNQLSDEARGDSITQQTDDMIQVPSRTSSESSDGTEEHETLEFIVGHDFMQQLVDKFGGLHNVGSMSPVVKFPIGLAQQIYDIIFMSSNPEEEDDGDYAMKLQCEEDERLARQMYEEMLQNNGQLSPPQLSEIMDMELAQAIYKADVDSLTKNSPETVANVLAKRLLEDNYQNIDKKTLHDVFVSCNYSFEDTVKTLQETLQTDESWKPSQEQKPFDQSEDTNLRGRLARNTSLDTYNEMQEYRSAEGDIEEENPWDLNDPRAHHNKYREKADEYLKIRDEMYMKASDAFRRKQRSVAAYYAKLGEVNGNKYQHASAMAAAALAASHSNAYSIDTLDLHHFKVLEAVTVFDLYVDYHIRILHEEGLQQQCLNVITGRGTHSVNGKPRIKPAILNRVKKRNLRCQPIASNPGVIKIWVTTSSRLSNEIADK